MFRLCTISFSSNVLNIGWFWMEWPLHETAFSFSCHAVLISIAIKKKNLMVFKNSFYINYQKDASIQKNWTDDHWESAVVKQAQTCASSAYNRVMFKTSQQFTFHLFGSCNYCVQPVKHGRLTLADTGDHGGEEPYDERWLERAMVIFSRVCVIRK